MWGKNLSTGFPNSPNTKLFDFKHFAPIIGSQLYSLESIGTLMCVRSTMKRRSQIEGVVLGVMSLASLFFILNGITFYFANYSSKSLTYFYYTSDKFVRIMEILFYLLTPSSIIINHMSNLCLVEEISFIKNILKSKIDENDFDISKLYVFRICLTTILIFPFFFSNLYLLW